MSVEEIDSLLTQAASRLHDAGVESPRREARRLLAHVLGVREEDIIAGQATHLTEQNLAMFERALARRIAREPLAYITGSREFWSREFAVGTGVLVPRPESEILIEEALRRFPSHGCALRVLDLGTGSGCLLLAFLSERSNARGVGVDISQDAIAFAKHNAKALGLDARVKFILGDWAENLSGAFDVIFVNPPYIKTSELHSLEPEVERYEPRAALNGGADGLDAYRCIAAAVPRHLSPEGLALFEVGQGQAESVGNLLAQAGLILEGTVCDLAGISRCLIARLTAPSVRPKKDLALETRSG
jgi:release factor glutamine methyltransferase